MGSALAAANERGHGPLVRNLTKCQPAGKNVDDREGTGDDIATRIRRHGWQGSPRPTRCGFARHTATLASAGAAGAAATPASAGAAGAAASTTAARAMAGRGTTGTVI
jgi:hypothetical protein